MRANRAVSVGRLASGDRREQPLLRHHRQERPRLVQHSAPLQDHPEARRRRQDGTLSDGSDLCGLHTGTALTDRSVQDSAALPDQIHIFREGIVKLVEEDFEVSWDVSFRQHVGRARSRPRSRAGRSRIGRGRWRLLQPLQHQVA